MKHPINRDDSVNISDTSNLRMPLRFFVAIIALAAGSALAWGITSRAVSDSAKRIEALELENRTNRELLLRIDERTTEIKRQMDRNE